MASADVSTPAQAQMVTDSLNQLTDVLIHRGDFASLAPEAISVLLAVRYAVQSVADHNYCPPSEELHELTGMSIDTIETGLDSLYRHGYLNRESFWRDGESHTCYRVRERQLMVNPEGEVDGELSWDLNNPADVFGLHEFRNLLASGSLGDAKVVHIERLQLNISSTRDDGVSVFHQPSTDEDGYFQDTVRPINAATQHILEEFHQRQQPIANDANQTQKAAAATNTAGDEPVTDVAADSVQPEQTTVNGTPADAASTASNTVSVADLSDALELERSSQPSSDEADHVDELDNEFKGVYQQYVARLHKEFSHALQTAEQAVRSTYHLKAEHQQQQPRQPIGLGMLLNGAKWQREMTQWQQEQLQLDNNYETSMAEQQRLMSALIPGTEGELPLYIREALEQIQLDHPHLATQAQRKLRNAL
ncbi:hypothetical protein CHH28_04575 [Bacterioplanes sanyensis]|uniref:Helix-turn-helix domain-containing protein n=1 Tax=Bacterioplanes sanyensis TaxID=1249553 RepID=A0A222FFZ8_9GAMM|nr:hypothetical protein [Bacterioplanes sanyensis]ASP37997.1 hypothetical protein CHH28_04575 [Bacterioplanes sanyensis]